MLAEATMKNMEESKKVSRRDYSVNSINKEDRINIRVTSAEKEKLQEASARKGITMSRMIMQLLEAAYL